MPLHHLHANCRQLVLRSGAPRWMTLRHAERWRMSSVSGHGGRGRAHHGSSRASTEMIAVEDVENEARHSRKECSRAGGAPTLVPALTVISRGHMHYPALSRYRLRGIGGPRKHPSFSSAVIKHVCITHAIHPIQSAYVNESGQGQIWPPGSRSA